MIFSLLGLFTAANAAIPGLQSVDCQVLGCGLKDYEGEWTVTSISPSIQQKCLTLGYKFFQDNKLALNNKVLFYESCTKTSHYFPIEGTPRANGKLTYFDVTAEHKIGQNLVPYPSTIAMVKVWKNDKGVVAASVQQPLRVSDTLTPETYYTLWLKKPVELPQEVIEQLKQTHDFTFSRFVDCTKMECTPQVYHGLWDVANIGPSLKSQCESLTYAVITNNPHTKQLEFRETCQKTGTTRDMTGVPSDGLMHFNSGEIQKLAGMIYYWKKNGVIVAASVQHPLLHATTNEVVRPLWFKRGMLTDVEKQRIMLQHSGWGS